MLQKYFKMSKSKRINERLHARCLCVFDAEALTRVCVMKGRAISITTVLNTMLIPVKINAYKSSLVEKLHEVQCTKQIFKYVSLNNLIVFKQTSHVSKKSQRLFNFAFWSSPFHFITTTRSALTIEENFIQADMIICDWQQLKEVSVTELWIQRIMLESSNTTSNANKRKNDMTVKQAHCAEGYKTVVPVQDAR